MTGESLVFYKFALRGSGHNSRVVVVVVVVGITA